MAKIKFLNSETYEKIAAGEIIENPSSIIQELLDNSIDAEATHIQIYLSKGGKLLIKFIDNGIGMDYDDLKIACLRHSTSKISTFQDIYKNSFLGFRGEALYAISKVSKIYIQSKEPETKLGTKLYINFGKVTQEEKLSMPSGTEIQIEKLFDKLPVRKLQLKSDFYEFQRIKNILIHKIIPFINIKLQIFHNNHLNLQVNPNENLLKRIKQIFLISENMPLLEINKSNKNLNIHLEAYISPLHYYHHQKNKIHIYINSRYLFYSSLYKAIIAAYGKLLPINRYPFAFLFIKIPYHFIDINVHPSKKTILLLTEKEIYEWILFSISEKIKNHLSIPNTKYKSFNSKKPVISSKEMILNSIQLNSKVSSQKKENKNIEDFIFNIKNNSSNENDFTEDPIHIEKNTNYSLKLLANKVESFNIFGPFFKNYFIIEYEETLLWIDQHAIHEILNYEKIKKKVKQLKKIEAQYLIQPIHIEIPKIIFENLSKINLKKIKNLGFEFEQFNEKKIILLSGPFFLNTQEIQFQFEKILYEPDKIPNLLEFLDHSITIKACRHSIKSGDYISKEGLIAIMQELVEYENYLSCPHGRPIIIEIHKNDIEKLFLRKK